ncbi:MAG: nucleotidyltransferase family protein [Burkholderiales bacterium]|nr:nucleotidyltransferase family protein [Anaerolineae bacterium]
MQMELGSVKQRAGWWPTHQQDLLLRAALLQGQEAVAAWEQWQSITDLVADILDLGSYRLMPLVYHNLTRQGVTGPQMQRLKGIYRHAWSQNQVHLFKLNGILRLLTDAGIEAMALKGAALMLDYYENVGLRPVQDVDVFVPLAQRDKAFAILEAAGWVRRDIVPDSGLPLVHAIVLEDRDRGEVDLHWFVYPETCYPGADDDLWEAAVTHSLNDLPLLILSPADQFFHACIHGAAFNSVPSIRWIADAMTILQVAETIDWQRVVQQAAKRHLSLRLRAALEYLVEAFNAPIPASVLADLAENNTPTIEVEEFAALQRQQHDWKVWRRYHFYRFKYGRLVLDGAPYRGPTGFIDFMKEWWGIEHAWELPFFGVRKARTVLASRAMLAANRPQNAP